jgi:preprotein translocase subunit SecG
MSPAGIYQSFCIASIAVGADMALDGSEGTPNELHKMTAALQVDFAVCVGGGSLVVSFSA